MEEACAKPKKVGGGRGLGVAKEGGGQKDRAEEDREGGRRAAGARA